MNYRKIVVAGGGVLGSQIAFQAAYCGYDVTIWLRSEESKSRTQPKLDTLKNTYTNIINQMDETDESNWSKGISNFKNYDKEECLKKTDNAYNGIKLIVDMAEAFKDADLVIESMAENKNAKIEFYQKLAPYLEEKTVLVTNSSTLLPSMFAKYTGRPEKYLALHFANSIWKNNTAEVMAHEGTDPKYFDEIMRFSQSIRMHPLPVKKEKSGYLLNSMLVPFLLSALDLVANEVSDPKSIDTAWTKGTGAPKGPFQIIDTVGLETAKNIVEQYQKVPGLMSPMLKKMLLPYNYKGMLRILNQYISENKLGRSTKEGFYKYDD